MTDPANRLLSVRGSAILAIMLVVAGCASSRSHTWHGDNSVEDMRATVRALIPRGTPVDEAQRILEAHGFECEFQRQEAFDERFNGTDPPDPPLAVNDFLRCRKSEMVHWCVSATWTVALVTEQGRTGKILVRCDYTGL